MKPFNQLTLRERCQFERSHNFNIADYRAAISHVKTADGYDIIYRGERIGETSKGWTRLGGAGWVNTYADGQKFAQRMSATRDSLADALRSAADLVMRRDVRNAYEASPVPFASDNAVPTLDEALDMIKAMVAADAKRAGVPVDEYVALRPWFKKFVYSATLSIPA